VVGVILNLAVWFGWHTLVAPDGGLDLFAALLGVASAVALVRLRWDIVPVVLASGALGLARHLLAG
jgi:chromate transporter